jgi:integrase
MTHPAPTHQPASEPSLPRRRVKSFLFKREDRDMGRRRGQVKGHLFEKGPSWILRWWEDDPGSPTGRSKPSMRIGPSKGPGALTRKQAHRVAREMVLDKIDRLGRYAGSMVTVAAYWERFRQEHVWTLKPSGREHWLNMMKNHILPALGKLQLREVNLGDVQKLVRKEIDRGHSVQTATHVRNCISGLFRHARARRYFVGELPTDGVRLPEMVRRDRRPLSWEQARAVIDQLDEPISTLALLLAVCGLRIGEACGLRWEHLDEQAGILRIRENWVRGARGSLKSRSGVRDIPVPGVLLGRLLALRSSGVTAAHSEAAPIFASSAGTPIDQHNVAARVLKPLLRRLGLGWASWHSFRHSAATFSKDVGLGTVDRMKVLGHGADRISLHYCHGDLAEARKAVEKVARRLTAKAEEKVVVIG